MLYVSEMITARGIVHAATRRRGISRASVTRRRILARCSSTAPTPKWLEEAARILVEEHDVDHLDINLGCPVRKVTASGGGGGDPLSPAAHGATPPERSRRARTATSPVTDQDPSGHR
jgi:tRNA-dihydrouridine synthase